MAPRKGTKTAKSAKKTSAAATKSAGSKTKPLATGDVEQFPKHVYRADMGEGLPPQAPPPTATDKAK